MSQQPKKDARQDVIESNEVSATIKNDEDIDKVAKIVNEVKEAQGVSKIAGSKVGAKELELMKPSAQGGAKPYTFDELNSVANQLMTIAVRVFKTKVKASQDLEIGKVKDDKHISAIISGGMISQANLTAEAKRLYQICAQSKVEQRRKEAKANNDKAYYDCL